MIKKGIVILGAGLLQHPLILAARNRGWHVISADQNPKAQGAQDSDIFLEVSTRNIPLLIETLKEHADNFQYCATLGTDMTASVAAINDFYNLKGLRPKQAAVTTHKGRMRKFLSGLGLLQPQYLVTTDRDKAFQWMEQVSQKNGYVIKPAHNMGARGVMFLEKPTDLGFAFEYAQAESSDGEIIIEEYVPADELSVDALCLKGEVFITGLADRNITIKDGRYFIETGHTMPTQRQPGIFPLVHEELGKISMALGNLENSSYTGALKGDIRITPRGEVLVGEVATRLSGGFMSTHTYPLSTGNNLLDGYLDILEESLPVFLRDNKNNAYRNVTIERAILADPGQVEYINIPEPLYDSNACLQNTFLHVYPGSLLESLQSNVGKPANVIISGETLNAAETYAEKIRQSSEIRVSLNSLSRNQINQMARKHFNKDFCHVCKICDGVNCASGVPGMGGLDDMFSFRDNLTSLSEISLKVLPGPECVADTSSKFMGKNLPFPILNGPITGSLSNMGGSITEYDYAIEVSSAMNALGLPCIFGDGADPLKYFTALEAIRQSKGGYIVVKPRADNRDIIQRICDAQYAGADGWGMDIDAINLKTMQNKGQATVKKSKNDIINISRNSILPFFIKGIMTIEDGLEMAEAGASAIIVSNHGGRVNNQLPGAARVLEAISTAVKKRYPDVQVYADGGIRSGEDVFKMLALGADGVLVGRPIVIAAVAAEKLGVYSVLKTYAEELQVSMQKAGCKYIQNVRLNHVKRIL